MLGAIIGDMCGSIYEHRNQRNIEMIDLLRANCYPTDDSVMTVAVARAMIDTMGCSDRMIENALIDSMHYFGNLFPRAGYGGTFRQWLRMRSREAYNSWGNGSAMRVSAVGWLYRTMNLTLQAAKKTADVTHNHPDGVKGAQAIAAAIFLARTGASKEEIKSYIEKNFYTLDFTLDQIRPSYYFDVSCQGSCPQAIEAFLEGNDFEDVIRKAISIGGDSDTIAAMAGGIAEAYYGIPEEMVSKTFSLLTDVHLDGERYNNSVIADEVKRFWEYLEQNDLAMPKEALEWRIKEK